VEIFNGSVAERFMAAVY